MAAVDRFRAAANYGRRAVDALGMRPTTVTITVETYSLPWNTTGATLQSTSTTVLSPRPKVVQASAGVESAFGGGATSDTGGVLLAGVYTIGPITPSFSAGGYTITQLAPAQTSPRVRVYVQLDGPEFQTAGEHCSIIGIDATHPLHTTMTVQLTALT